MVIAAEIKTSNCYVNAATRKTKRRMDSWKIKAFWMKKMSRVTKNLISVHTAAVRLTVLR